MSDEIKPGTGDEKLNQDTGDTHDESEMDAILSELDEETQAKVMEAVNKGSKKDFKDFKGLVKSLKEADVMAAKIGAAKAKETEKTTPVEKQTENPGGHQETVETTQSLSPAMKRIFFNQEPDAKYVWDEVERVAKLTNKDPIEVYAEESFFQEKAKALSEENKKREEAKGKGANPSNHVGKGKVDFSNVTDAEVAEMSLDDFEKFSDWKAAQSKAKR